MKVFIENEAGSFVKHIHDEKALELKATVKVSRAYPFPYGFVLDTTGEDGDNVDCFVLCDRPLNTGDIVDCEPVALMEQIEDGEIDHKILANLVDAPKSLDQIGKQTLIEFATHVFEHIPGKRMKIGQFLGREAALEYLEDHQDKQGNCSRKNGLFQIDL